MATHDNVNQEAEIVYKTKVVQFLGRSVPIILQNDNGPCPLLAICECFCWAFLPIKSRVNLYMIYSEVELTYLSCLLPLHHCQGSTPLHMQEHLIWLHLVSRALLIMVAKQTMNLIDDTCTSRALLVMVAKNKQWIWMMAPAPACTHNHTPHRYTQSCNHTYTCSWKGVWFSSFKLISGIWDLEPEYEFGARIWKEKSIDHNCCWSGNPTSILWHWSW